MAEPSRHNSPCPRCAVLERRVAELEAHNARMAARGAGHQAETAALKRRITELERLPLDATRAGKAILCHRDKDYVAPVLPQLVTA